LQREPSPRGRSWRWICRIGEHFFLEAAGVGLDAGLFGYFERLERGGSRLGALRAALRFLHQLGSPRVSVEYEGGRIQARAPMVSVANGQYVGAAHAIALEARIDDGLLDVVVFRHTSIPRVLLHLALVAGGRPLPHLLKPGLCAYPGCE
jgi:diacylglycerol kinase (ATP)